MRIPKSVEIALLKHRKGLNQQAELFNKHASKTSSMVVQTEALDSELEFWNIKNDEELDEFLLELPYALLLAGSDFDWSTLPEGYGPLSTMLEFELSCQNEGWGSLCNYGEEEVRSVIDAYRYLGLTDEAAALDAVLEKYIEIDSEDEQFHELIGAAYGSVENKTPELEDRLEVVRQFVRENQQLLASRER